MLILHWTGSAYNSLRELLQLIGRELTDEGFQVETFAIADTVSSSRLAALLSQGGYVFALTMSGIAADCIVEDGRPIWEAAQVPLFNWNCDHPSHLPRKHAIRSRFVLHGYVFPDHARYSLHHLNPNGAAFAVHIGLPPRRIFAGAPLPATSRNGRIFFSKSGRDTKSIEAQWNSGKPILRSILFDAAEELFQRSTADFLPVVQQLGEEHGLLLDGSSELTLTLIRELDLYIRYKRGNLLVRTLLRHPVDVVGTGWEHVAGDGMPARFLGAIGFGDVLQQLPSYLGCLSMNPLIDNSVHDRVFFALAAGVAPSSDSNAFSRTHMPMLELYSFTFERERIEAAIDALLSNPQEALDRAEAAYQALAPRFTMRRAAQQIVQFSAMRTGNARLRA